MKSRPTTTFLQLLLLSLLKRVKVGLFTNRPTIYTLCPPNFSVLGGGGGQKKEIFFPPLPSLFSCWGGGWWQNMFIFCPPPFFRGAFSPPPPLFRSGAADEAE